MCSQDRALFHAILQKLQNLEALADEYLFDDSESATTGSSCNSDDETEDEGDVKELQSPLKSIK